jgi:hypothetical protein
MTDYVIFFHHCKVYIKGQGRYCIPESNEDTVSLIAEQDRVLRILISKHSVFCGETADIAALRKYRHDRRNLIGIRRAHKGI